MLKKTFVLYTKTQGFRIRKHRTASFLSTFLAKIFPPKSEPEPFLANCICIGNFSFMNGMTGLNNIDKDNGLCTDIVRVFHNQEEDKVQIVMEIHGNSRTVNRPPSEPLCMSLERIKTNIKNANAKLQKKYNKKFKKDDNLTPCTQNEPTAALFDQNGLQIDDQMTVIEAWNKGRKLKICDLYYDVVCNPPQVENVKLLNSPLAGFPIHPQLRLKMATLENSRFEWYKLKCHNLNPNINHCEVTDMDTDVSGKHKMESSDAESIECDESESDGWELVSNEKTYTATAKDIGYSLKLIIWPGNERYPHDSKAFRSEPVSVITEGVVIKGPDKCIFDDRSQHTVKRCEKGRFRLVCYNILADVYASTEYAHDFLFPYCPTHAMDIGYRQQLIVKELIVYNADIICLQEVDRFVFETQLMPAMSLEGFAGAFAAKDGIKEGVALFYRRDKFRLLMVDNIILRKAFKDEKNNDLNTKIRENETFFKNVMSKPTCLLVGLLQSLEDENKTILIGNTHLYWHPHGCHVRLIQAEVILREMRNVYAKYSDINDKNKKSPTCIITGDFNSSPHSGVVQLLTQGEVKDSHADWYSMGKAEYISGLQLSSPSKFESACGYPEYSNFVTRFRNCLDYIFIDPQHLNIDTVVPPPAHEDVVRFTALPNVSAPSDHIAQVVDLSWRD